MITNENYEEYMMLLADGELSQSGTEELKAFIEGNKELEQELANYMNARIVPDTREIFRGKEELLKKSAPARIIGLQKNRAYGIAATLLLLVFIGFLTSHHTGTDTVVITKTDSIRKSQVPVSQVPVKSPGPLAVEEKSPENVMQTPKRYLKQTVKTTRTIITRVKKEDGLNNIAHVKPKTPDSVKTIAVQQKKPFLIDTAGINAVKTCCGYSVDKLAPKEPIADEETEIKPKRNFFARLPIVGKKNVGINLVTDAVGEKVSRVKQIRNNLKNTDVVIKIGNKELLAFNL